MKNQVKQKSFHFSKKRKKKCFSLFFIESVRIKKPNFNEKNQSIRFDIGLFQNIERFITIRIIDNHQNYSYQTYLKTFRKFADGHRHQVFLFL